jgi:RNA polymerase sigma-70 factor (ECF subfamily)
MSRSVQPESHSILPLPRTPVRHDEEWAESIRSGDAEAFESLFHAYHAPLCAFAYRYLGVRDLAEDMVQEVFLFVWERRESLAVRTSIRSYLFTAVRNAALSHLRHERVVRRREADTRDRFALSVSDADAEASMADTLTAVRHAIDRLPERCRLVFTLHREQGLTYSEIAEVLHISAKTVEVQMGRALKSLRKSLNGLRG